jgi:thiol:disulfide interchange protein
MSDIETKTAPEQPETTSAAPTSTGQNNDSNVPESGVIAGEKLERKLSALRDNIKEKGQYSYYYGHTMDTPEVRAEREAALRIQELQKSGSPQKAIKTTVVVTRPKKPISQYSWSIKKKKVTVYIPTENMDLTEDVEELKSAAHLTTTDTSVQLVVTDKNSGQHLFQVPRLYDEIESATFKYAPEKTRITISLKKKTHFTWANLHRGK